MRARAVERLGEALLLLLVLFGGVGAFLLLSGAFAGLRGAATPYGLSLPGDGARTAFVEILDGRTNATLHRGPVRPGDTVAGCQILAVTADAVRVRIPGGEEHDLPLRQSRTVELP